MNKVALTLAIALLAAGCSTVKLEERRYYLMRLPAAESIGPVESPAYAGIREIAVAPYLEDLGVALETRPNEIQHAKFNKWSEPVGSGFANVMRSELSSALGREVANDPSLAGEWRYAIDVAIDRFHGTAGGDALLVATWRITRSADAAEVSFHRFSQRQPLAEPGYPALVAAEIDLVRSFSRAVAESLRDLP